MTHRNLRPAMRLGLLPAAVAVALVPAIAGAQEAAPAAQEATTLDRIEVTGSRIRGVNMETQQPIVTLSREEIQKQGFTSVADVLQNLTSAGSPAISRSEALASGENVGGYYIDIRNLGANRTLVLVNGKRLGATTGGYQDLSQIPMSAIDRMEILKDGASAIYGSDAIAGVVNVITRKRFEGAEATAYVGQFGEGDGETQQYSFTVGQTSDRGGTTLSVEYSKEEPVFAGDRWFSKWGNAGPDYPGSGFSPVSQNGSWYGPCGPGGADTWCTLSDGGDPTNLADYRPHTTADNANSNLQMMLRTGIERRSVFASTTYDVSDSISFDADVLYNQRITDQQIAGYPYQSLAFDTQLSGDSAFNPVGEDIDFRRRLWEVPRTTRSELETYRFAGGFKGFFQLADKYWDWDVGALLNRNSLSKTGHGDASLIATRQALGPSFINGDGIAQCGTAADPISLDNCRPWNPLLPNGVAGQGSLADADLQTFMFPYFTDTGTTRTTSYTANVSGSLAELPAGDLGIAMGYEHRKESGRFVPDAFAQSGEYTGLAATTTEGDYALDEFYVELNIPVLADMAFAKELTFNVASRYSDYSNFGDTTNSKFGFTWRPIDSVLVRGTWSEGFRAPTVSDLFGGISQSFEYYTDPCDTSFGSVAGSPQCLADVPAGYRQPASDPDGLADGPGTQTPIPFLSGSSPNLTPETSESSTLGVVWSPEFVEGLNMSLDWWNIRIDNTIVGDDPTAMLDDCYIRGIQSRCQGPNTFTRDPVTGEITELSFGLRNAGFVETEGFDFDLNYRMETDYGRFGLAWLSTYVSKNEIKVDNLEGVPSQQNGFGGNFRLRSNASLSWDLGEFGATWTARYYSGVKENCYFADRCSLPNYAAPDTQGNIVPLNELGSTTFHDVQVRWNAPWNATVSLGANNVFEKYASPNYDQPNSGYSYYGGFDIGRFVYMKYQQRF